MTSPTPGGGDAIAASWLEGGACLGAVTFGSDDGVDVDGGGRVAVGRGVAWPASATTMGAGGGATAAAASIRPWQPSPHRAGRAVARIRCTASAGLRPSASSRATTPLTWAAATDAPLRNAYRFVALGADRSRHVETTSRPSPVADPPGATTPHFADVRGFEYGASTPRMSVAPTTSASTAPKSSWPGPSDVTFPAATTGTAPAAHASSTAFSNERSSGRCAAGLSATLRLTTWAPCSTTQRIPASTSRMEPPSLFRTLATTKRASGATPATPRPLSFVAVAIPAISVPWPLSSSPSPAHAFGSPCVSMQLV